MDVVGAVSASLGARLGAGTNLTWGGAYGAGIPTIAGSSGNLLFYPAGSTSGESMRLDYNGNLGLGVTPSAWSGYGLPVLELPSGGTIVSAGTSQNLGANWYYSGGSFLYKTTAAATYFQQASGAFKWYTAPSGTAGDAISFTQAMSLDSSGNLLVGTTTASEKLSVVSSGASSTGIQLNQTGSGGRDYRISSTGTGYGSAGNLIIYDATAGAERARIDSSGNLYVGTTSSYGRATIEAGSNSNGLFVINDTYDYQTLSLWNKAGANDNLFARFFTESSLTLRGSITYNRGAGLTAYNTTSDYRAKDIIGPVTDSGSLIDSVPVYIGKMKGATQERPMFIAHETPAYAHTGEKDAVDADGNPVYQQMDASALIPVMWAEIQSLRQRLAAAGI